MRLRRAFRSLRVTYGAAKPRRFLMIVMIFTAAAGSASAQSDNPVGPAGETTPRDIIDRLVREREPSPVVTAEMSPDRVAVPERVGVPAPSVDIDPAVLGVVPGAPLPTLRREGEFVLERPGRLVAVEDGLYQAFVFDDVAGLQPLRPMILHKCQRLGSMEEAVRQRGEDLLFTLTGEVTTYRGVNYLLPTRIAGTRSLAAATRPADDGPAPAALPPTAVQRLREASDNAPGPSPGSTPGNAPPPTLGPAADARDVMDALFQQRGSEVTRPDPRGDATAPPPLPDALGGTRPEPAAAEGSAAAAALREGEYLVSRAGRLIRGRGVEGVMFSFEADAADSPEARCCSCPAACSS